MTRKRNPVPPSSASRQRQVDDAADLYKRFSGHTAEQIGEIDKPEFPDALICVGTIDFIGYTTTRDSVVEKYIHTFKAKSRPLFCVSPDGKQIVIVGGQYDFTERGIVDRTN